MNWECRWLIHLTLLLSLYYVIYDREKSQTVSRGFTNGELGKWETRTLRKNLSNSLFVKKQNTVHESDEIDDGSVVVVVMR